MEIKKIKELNISGNVYKIIFDKSKLENYEWGYCDIKNKQIIIREDLSDEYVLGVILREYLHAVDHHCGLGLSYNGMTSLYTSIIDFMKQTQDIK